MYWEWKTRITEPVHLGFILDNTLVLRTRVRVLEVQVFHHGCINSVMRGTSQLCGMHTLNKQAPGTIKVLPGGTRLCGTMLIQSVSAWTQNDTVSAWTSH